MTDAQTRTIALLALGLLGCATTNTRLESSWTAPGAQPFHFKKVMAIAFVNDEGRRRTVEDRMCADIKALGTQTEAVPSYTLIPTADLRDQDAVKPRVEAAGFDGAVAWRAAGTDREKYYVPGGMVAMPVAYAGFWGFYQMGITAVYDPGYLQTDKVVHIETMVYRVGPTTDKLVWAGTSATVDPASLYNLVDGVAYAVSAELQRQGLLTSG